MKYRLTKVDAARRQLDAAIRMTFAGEDATAIHSVASAAAGIIRSLCEQDGRIESYLRFTDWIAPGQEAAFWRHMNASANFLKHADIDPGKIHDLDDEETDFVIMFAAKWFRELSGSSTNEMTTFAVWFMLRNPTVVKSKSQLEDDLAKLGFAPIVEQAKSSLPYLLRSDWQKLGMQMLNGARRWAQQART